MNHKTNETHKAALQGHAATRNASLVPERRRRPRGKGLRVRTGCSSCRERHLKCDEAQPSCRACQTSARECIYPQQPPQPPQRAPRTSREVTSKARSNEDDPGQPLETAPEFEVPSGNVTINVDAARPRLPVQQSLGSGIRRHTFDTSNTLLTSMSRELYLNGALTEPSRGRNEDCAISESQPDDQSQGTFTTIPMQSEVDATYFAAEAFGFTGQDGIEFPGVYDAELFGISPDANLGGWPSVSAEAASRWWFDLLASDIASDEYFALNGSVSHDAHAATSSSYVDEVQHLSSADKTTITTTSANQSNGASMDEINLTDTEIQLFHHFVTHLSGWIDATDPDQQFAVVVPHIALRNRGLASAILALSSLHLSLEPMPRNGTSSIQIDSTSACQYYNETLRYLQSEMADPVFLRSDELLATVLLISLYEMIDGPSSAWEKHLKGVFWIQRSQVIHGESEGLKKRVWWAWLRQDIWAAFRSRRKILSFYKVTRPCTSLNFWELIDRAVYLLGQCVDYASEKEEEIGRSNLQRRLDDSSKMWEKLEEWRLCFEIHDRRLPTARHDMSFFQPIWINPPAASLAVQVHNLSKLLLLEYTPAIGGMKELTTRHAGIQSAVAVICGIAYCTVAGGPTIVSTQCVFAAGHHVQHSGQRTQIIEILHAHRERTQWPAAYDIAEELRTAWAESDSVK